jgi:hypothetical protein
VIKVLMDSKNMDDICCNMDGSGCKGRDKDNQDMNDKVRPLNN